MYRDRTVKAQEFQVMLKEAINVIDLDKNNYNTHSLHIGRVKESAEKWCKCGVNKKHGQMEIQCHLQASEQIIIFATISSQYY